MLATNSSWFRLDLWLLRVGQRGPGEALVVTPASRLVGSLAMLLAMRRASSRVSALATCGVAVDVGKRLTSRVHDLEAAL